MRIGWLQDDPGYQGGAELEAATLVANAPAWAKIIPCPPSGLSEGVDCYVIHNCVPYGTEIITALEKKPVIKRVYDVWQDGSHDLKQWLLKHAGRVVFSSPLHREVIPWQIDAPVSIIPGAVDLEPFQRAGRQANGRKGHVWINRLFRGKGLKAAKDYAKRGKITIDVYGYGALQHEVSDPLRYIQKLPYQKVPEILAQYETLVFLPSAIEPYSRIVVEAWATGCKLVINGNVGALHWIQNEPYKIADASKMFWDIVKEVGNG